MCASPALAVLVALVGLSGPAGRVQPPAAPPPAQVPVEKPWPPPGVVRAGSGIPHPRLIKEAHASYTPGALSAKVQGVVVMEVVVQADGTVGDVRVVRSLDRQYGLDDEAVKAVKKWQFEPAKKEGVVVPVLVDVEMTFSLRK